MVRDITFKGTKDEFQGSIYLSSNSKVPILDIKIKSSSEVLTAHGLMFCLVTLNRGIVKSVNVSDFEATIFFCDYGSVANIHVSL